MPFVPYGFVHQTDLDAEISQALRDLGPTVVRVNYNIGEDTTGDPAIHFRVVLTDNAARREVIGRTTRSIMDTVTERLAPLPKWGLFPYFSFRSQSEQATMNDPEWP
jgi:hypothetical protein